MMGKVTSKLSSSVMSASMAAVAIVDYSINKFGTEAIEGRASIYRDAYSIYYQKGKPGYRSAADWYNKLYPLFSAGNLSESELKAEIDRMVTAHCDEFWGGGNKDGVDAYVDEAEKNGVDRRSGRPKRHGSQGYQRRTPAVNTINKN